MKVKIYPKTLIHFQGWFAEQNYKIEYTINEDGEKETYDIDDIEEYPKEMRVGVYFEYIRQTDEGQIAGIHKDVLMYLSYTGHGYYTIIEKILNDYFRYKP